jgi:hypothetical protein
MTPCLHLDIDVVPIAEHDVDVQDDLALELVAAGMVGLLILSTSIGDGGLSTAIKKLRRMSRLRSAANKSLKTTSSFGSRVTRAMGVVD